MQYFFLFTLIFYSFSSRADYKCTMELFNKSDLTKPLAKNISYGMTNGYNSPKEEIFLVEKDQKESLSSIMAYVNVGAIDELGEIRNSLSMSVMRRTIFWGKNDDYNKWTHQSFGRILISGDEEKFLDFENYRLKVICLIAQIFRAK